jgi:prevent-host-death family protein
MLDDAHEGDYRTQRGMTDAASARWLSLIAVKRVSVAQAKNTLLALLHEAESEPIEIVRRGKPVAVILSRANYDRLRGENDGVWSALERFHAKHDLEELDAPSAFSRLRDRQAEGRPVRR